MEKSFFEARSQAFAEVGANAIDWNQADLLHIPYLQLDTVKSFASIAREREQQRMIIGLGTDVAEVERFDFDDAMLGRFAKKVFTVEELAHARRYRHRAERLAGAFAAKEATRKAFGHAIPWRMVGVRHQPSGKPYIELSGGAERLIALRGVRHMHLTVAHSRENAVATVILEGDDVAGAAAAQPYSVGEAAR